MFSVALGLLPVFFNFLSLLTFGPELSWALLLGNGELLLLSVGLSAAALGDLIAVGREWEKFKIVLTASSAGNIALASFYFAAISQRSAEGEPTNGSVVAIVSLVLYALALACSGSCIAVAERR